MRCRLTEQLSAIGDQVRDSPLGALSVSTDGRARCPSIGNGSGGAPFSFSGGDMEKSTVLQSVRLTPADYAALRQMAGPGGGSRFVRALIRAEVAKREAMSERPMERARKERKQ